jgi:hypothetical protein
MPLAAILVNLGLVAVNILAFWADPANPLPLLFLFVNGGAAVYIAFAWIQNVRLDRQIDQLHIEHATAMQQLDILLAAGFQPEELSLAELTNVLGGDGAEERATFTSEGGIR